MRDQTETIIIGRDILPKVDIVHEILMKHVRTIVRDGIAHGTNGTCDKGDFYGLRVVA